MCGGDRGGSAGGRSAAVGRLEAQDKAAKAGPGDPTGEFGETREAGKTAAKTLGKVTGPLGGVFGALAGALADLDTNPGGPGVGLDDPSRGGRGVIRAKGILSAGDTATTSAATTAAADPATAAAEDTRRAASSGRRSTILAGRSIAKEQRKTLLGQ